jgi:hypothetical protein
MDLRMAPLLVTHCNVLVESFRRWTGRELVAESPSPTNVAQRLFDAPFVLLSHGTETDPILNYGNRMALALWETTWDRFTRMPSRLTAEPQARDERARALADVTSRGYVDDYGGIRMTVNGRRFLIERAVVWSVVDRTGRAWGQAARFDRWTYLDAC